jgi:hypothetical protein
MATQWQPYEAPPPPPSGGPQGLNGGCRFALSGAAGAPIQFFVSGKHASAFAPERPAQLRYIGLFFVQSWRWEQSAAALSGISGLRCG